MASYSASLETPLGRLFIGAGEEAILSLSWQGTGTPDAPTPLLRQAILELRAYFSGRLKAFDLPLAPHGTAFDKRVWEAMRAIPYGKTSSYGAIAGALGTSARAVGRASSRNPIPIIIPCHRVVATHGLGGYSGGEGLPTKERLLALEGGFLFAPANRAAGPSRPTRR